MRESPVREGGYRTAPFVRQSTGPQGKLEALLEETSSSELTLRALVFEFPDGLPERLRWAVWSRLLGVESTSKNISGLQKFMLNGKLNEVNQVI